MNHFLQTKEIKKNIRNHSNRRTLELMQTSSLCWIASDRLRLLSINALPMGGRTDGKTEETHQFMYRKFKVKHTLFMLFNPEFIKSQEEQQ